MKPFLLITALLVATILPAQIRLPKAYVCSANSDWSRTVFTGGNNVVEVAAMGREMEDVKAVIAYYKKLGYPFSFQKAADGLWWGTGTYRQQAYYIIIEPQSLFAFSVITTVPATASYGSFCEWLLKAIRAERKRTNGNPVYLVNYKGQSCKKAI